MSNEHEVIPTMYVYFYMCIYEMLDSYTLTIHYKGCVMYVNMVNLYY